MKTTKKATKSRRYLLRRIGGYLRPQRAQMIAAMSCAALSVLFTLLGPVFVGQAVDEICGPGRVNFKGMLGYLAMLGISMLLAAGTQWALQICTRKLSARTACGMRKDAFAALGRAPLNVIDRHAGGRGDFISRIGNDAELVAEGLLQGLTQLLPGVATIAGTLIVMMVLNPFIALVVVLVTPVSILFAGFVTRRTERFFKQQSAAQGQISGFIDEMVTGQSVVKVFGAEDRCFKQFDAISDTLYETGLKSVFYSAIVNPGTRFVNAVVYAAVGVFGAIAAVQGGISVGQLSCFLTYANQYTKPFNEVTGVLTQLQSAQAGAERLLAVIDTQPETPDAQNAIAPQGCEGRVELRDVSFSYSPNTVLIEHFTLCVQPGQRVAIVGPTGCGKTTLINLLMRFYEVQAGDIYVDGTSIQIIRREALRKLYGMVLQESWLKNATVHQNIAYGCPQTSREEVIQAAKMAHAHSFIKRLPQGYDTVIVQSGANLSAGQKQLLCIARIMLCQPEMLILDEATSSIDTRTELLVQRAFATLMEGRTSFVVAHRLSTIQSADIILVMNAGQVVEQGTHEALLEKNGFYARLYRSQFAPE